MKCLYFFFAATMLLCLSGCKKAVKTTRLQYEPAKVTTSTEVTNRPVEFTQKKSDLILQVKRITAAESKELFNGVNFIKHKIQPLQCTLYNNSNEYCVLFSHAIGIPLLHINQIKALCNKFSLLHLIGATIKALIIAALVTTLVIITPILLVTAFLSHEAPLALMLLSGFIFFPLFSVPVILFGGVYSPVLGITLMATTGLAILTGTTSWGMIEDEELITDIQGRMASSKMIIEPKTKLDFLMLVNKQDYQPEFPITVQCSRQPITFEVKLPE